MKVQTAAMQQAMQEMAQEITRKREGEQRVRQGQQQTAARRDELRTVTSMKKTAIGSTALGKPRDFDNKNEHVHESSLSRSRLGVVV